MTPTRRPSSCRGRCSPPRDHRREGPLHERTDPHHVAAALAGEPEVVDVHDRDVRPPAPSSFSESVEAAGTRTSRLMSWRSSAPSRIAV